METILIKRRANEGKTLIIPVPDTLLSQDLEVLVVMQPVILVPEQEEKMDEDGWPIGFFEATYGSLADDPIERLPQRELEIREAIL